MRKGGVPEAAIRAFRHYWEQLVAGETGLLSEAEIIPVEHLPDSRDVAAWRDRGAEALAGTVVIKLNGGLGTSMGMTRAKSLLAVRGDSTFLDFTARQILHLRREHGCRLPLVLMNSFRTRDDSLHALRAYPELDVGLPLDFLQNKVPKVLAEDGSPASMPGDPEHEWCPPGHGDIYTALVTSGLLASLLERGFEHAFVSNSDNLGAVLDLPVLGWFAGENLPFLMEVCERTEADKKGGHLAARQGGGLVLREVAQCPESEMRSFQDIRRYRFFNTNTLWVNLVTLQRVLGEQQGFLPLPLIRNAKTLDPTDDTSPRVFQLETAMGAAISVFEGARAILVPRERFLPVKTTNDLLGIRSDVYRTTEDHRIVPVEGRSVGDLVVDLDARWFRRVDQLEQRFPFGPPSLERCRRLTVRGDVRFGRGVVCRGEQVSVVHEAAGTLSIPDGEVLG
ncbi:MAG: UTP--glucose-1-phosphate uridylyltransferase [Candidatus Eiseniibacteriota bacterium]